MKRILYCLEITLLAMALAMIGYCAYVYVDAQWYQKRAVRELGQLSKTTHHRGPRPREGTPLGLMVIPHLGLSSAILEGTGDTTLQRGVGHVAGTALPGQAGNICLAGHRDSFFRPLRDIANGDEIEIQVPGNARIYRVEETRILDPDQTAVLEPTRSDVLTLITCYPFHFIGSAPQRFVVRAKLVTDHASPTIASRESPTRAAR